MEEIKLKYCILRIPIHDSYNNSSTNFIKAVGEFMGIVIVHSKS
jgi:hypothetical protein